MLTLYRRHNPECPSFGKPRRDVQRRKCDCSFWVNGVLAGHEVRISLKTRDTKKAEQLKHDMETEERVIERHSAVTLADAWTKLLADLEARNLSLGTIRKYKLLQRQMAEFAEPRKLSLLNQFNYETLSSFRATWKDGPRTSSKKLERLRAFFGFCLDCKWIDENPARKIKLPKVKLCPTLPLEPKEMLKIMVACDGLIAAAEQPAAKLNASRLKTLILLMKHSGLRVSDAVVLTVNRIKDGKLFLYTQKTGTQVYIPLRPDVLRALDETPRVTDDRFFWSGNGKRETVVCDWQGRIKEVFDAAGISKGEGNAVSHRLRDTFAVQLLLAGTPIERVSVLLGHDSVKTTEKHYKAWTKSRQEQVEADVAAMWKLDPDFRTPSVHGGNERPN
jgi:integrase/recombinase XerD